MNREQAMKLAEAVREAVMQAAYVDKYYCVDFHEQKLDLAAIVDAHVAQAGQVVPEQSDFPTAFVTTESGNGTYRLVLSFASLADLHEGHRRILAAVSTSRRRSPVNQQMLAALNRLADASRPVATALYNIGQSHEDWSSLRPLIAELDNALSHGCYEGPIMHSAMEEVRKKSGAWTPLYTAPPRPAPPRPAPPRPAPPRRAGWVAAGAG